MLILGIETSCDETAASVVENGTKVLSNVIASSEKLHIKTGGIIPENAARQQVLSIIPVIKKALIEASEIPHKVRSSHVAKSLRNDEAGLDSLPASSTIQQLDAIAVTYGPGLIGSLLVGVETAKTLSYLWKKPIIPVNHLVAHIYANFIHEAPNSPPGRARGKSQVPKFPAIALVVSGGHTDLVLMKGHGKIKWLGGTRDDAAGEAFDKCARLLGLPYPGGPSISANAEKFLNSKSKIQNLDVFPRPMINSDNFDFSFSGLKTSVFNRVKKKESKSAKDGYSIPQLSAEIQEAIVDLLVTKSLKAIDKFKPKSFLLSGGVAANKRLRTKLKSAIEKQNDLEFHVPPVPLCTDNAAMIAAAAFFNYRPVPWKKVTANPQLTISGEN